jgi:hypothetical protein
VLKELTAPTTQAPKPPEKLQQEIVEEQQQQEQSSSPQQTIEPPTVQAPKPPPQQLQEQVKGNQEVSEQVYGNESRMPDGKGTGKVIGKYGLATSLVGTGFGVGTHVDTNGGGVGSSGVTSGLGLVQSGLGLHYSKQREKESNLFGDEGGTKLSQDEGNNSKLGLTQGGLGLTQTGVKTASIIKHGEKGVMTLSDVTGKTSGMVSSGLTIGTEVLGIAGHAISAVQSGYELFCATSKLWPKIKDKIVSAAGQRWRGRIMNRQKVKASMQALKLAAAGIGIAAGILVLASNPVGWALGIGAAVVGAGFALGKIGNAIRQAWKRRQARKELEKNGDKLGLSKQELEQRQNDQGDEQESSSQSEESSGKTDKKQVTEEERDKVKAMADEVAAMVSENAAVAREMHLAVKDGESSFFAEKLRLTKIAPTEVPEVGSMNQQAQEYFDACTLVQLLKVSPKQAGSSSGSELLESKISALNGS